MPIDRKTDFSSTWAIHGTDYSDPLWIEGGSVTFDGFGLMTFRGSIQGRDVFDLSELKGYGIPIWGEDLKSAGQGFYVSKITKKLQQNHTAIFDIEAIGIEPRCKGQTRISAEGMSTCSMEPIETHWNFPNIGGTPESPMNGATFDSNRKFTGFGVVKQVTNSANGADKSITSQEPLAGVRSYYAPKQTFRAFFHCDAKLYRVSDLQRLTANPVTNDGTISGIRLMPVWAVDGGSWMLVSLTPEPIVNDTDGNPVLLKVSYELLRARTVWNPLIYISGSGSKK